jgi:hypothetical protein
MNTVRSDLKNANEAQVSIAKGILGDDEYAKIACAETDALEAKYMNPKEVSRGMGVTAPTPKPIEITPKVVDALTVDVKNVGSNNMDIQMPDNIKVPKKIMDAIDKTSKMVGLDVRLGRTLVHTESGFDPNCTCGNKGYKDRNGVYHEGSVDYGLTQLNNRGGPIGDFLGKKIDLADGRKQVEVTTSNYRNDMYVNLYIGLASYKHYLTDLSGNNPFIAYACYNAGEGSYEVFRGQNKAELTKNEVCDILTETGRSAFKQASKNVKNNFAEKYSLYFK